MSYPSSISVSLQRNPFAAKPIVTPPSGGIQPQSCFPKDNLVTPWVYDCSYHIKSITKAVELGRRLIFSTPGREVAVHALCEMEKLVDSDDPLLAPNSLIDAMKTYLIEYEAGRSNTTIVIDTKMTCDGYNTGGRPYELRISHKHVTAAAETLLARGENSAAYKRHIFFLGTIVAHQAMHGLRAAHPIASYFSSAKISDTDHVLSRSRDLCEYLCKREGGWALESMLFGGWLGRVIKDQEEDDFHHNDEIKAIVVRCPGSAASGSPQGHVEVDDKIIAAAVDGAADWEKAFPLRAKGCGQWRPGFPKHMVEQPLQLCPRNYQRSKGIVPDSAIPRSQSARPQPDGILRAGNDVRSCGTQRFQTDSIRRAGYDVRSCGTHWTQPKSDK